MAIGYYSGTLMYTNLCTDNHLDRRYGEGLMSLSVKKFQACAAHISNELEDSDESIHHVWIVPASFNLLQSINDLR